jgi:hypothetical protein
MRDDIKPIAGGHYQAGLAIGLADDSPQLEAFILEETARTLEHRRKLREAPPVVDDREASSGYDREAAANAWALEREAEELQRTDEWAQRESTPEPRRNIQYSAPVSRDAPSVSTGRPQSLGNTVTLSRAEREVARNSFTDPTMTDEAKERLFAMNKLKMLRMRAAGTLNE